jgi:hypothetical protein
MAETGSNRNKQTKTTTNGWAWWLFSNWRIFQLSVVVLDSHMETISQNVRYST